LKPNRRRGFFVTTKSWKEKEKKGRVIGQISGRGSKAHKSIYAIAFSEVMGGKGKFLNHGGVGVGGGKSSLILCEGAWFD